MTDAYLELVPRMAAHDRGIGIMILLCAVVSLGVLWRWHSSPRFQRIAGALGRVAVPLYVVGLNPFIALLAAPTSFLPMPRRVRRPLLYIILLAAGLRLPHLLENLWYDETFTARMARMDLAQFWTATAQDIHPPLHNLLVWAWGHIGGYSVLWLRLPHFAVGLLSVLLMYHLARALRLDNRAALLAALALAIMPSAIYYGVELRAYVFMSCFLLGALLAVLHNRPMWFLLLCPLMYLFHHYGLMYAAVIGAAAFAYWHNRRWFAAGACVAFSMLLWLPFVLKQSATITDGFWIYNEWGKLPSSFIEMTLQATREADYRWLILPAAALLTVSLFMSRRWLATRPALLLAALLFGVPALALVVSYALMPLFVARYLYPSMILFAIPLAIAASKSHIVGRSALALALVGVAVGFINPRTPFRELAEQGCPTATAYYHLNLEAAFIVGYLYPDALHLVLPNATDQGAGLNSSDIPVFGFTPGEITEFSGQSVCVLDIESALTTDREIWSMRWFKSSYEHPTPAPFFDAGITYTFYQFEVQ